MLTISQLASYAGVTVRAVRHYHAKGLLPEPERDHSGYRRYNAAAVVELIRIRTLAQAGVPLSRVRELLAAGDEEFAVALADIDRRLRAEIRERQRHREEVSQLSAGDSLALPPEAVAYLDRMRELGFPQHVIEIERDSWILIAAQIPEQVPAFIAIKHAQIEQPVIRRLYLDVAELAECAPDDPPAAVARRPARSLVGSGRRRCHRDGRRTANQRRPRHAARRCIHRVLPMRAASPQTPRRTRLDRLDQHPAPRTPEMNDPSHPTVDRPRLTMETGAFRGRLTGSG